jgi:fibronectin-binding autotransporter adhesin
MWKTLLLGLCGFVLSASWALPTRAAGLTTLNEGFENDVPAGLTANGWLLQNNSTNVAGASTPNWIQGNATFGTAQAGTIDSFIAANFQNTGTFSVSSTISNWLVTPQLTLTNGDIFSFFTMTTNGSFANDLQVRLDTTGSSPNVGTLPTDVGNFTTTLLEIGSSSSTGPATPNYPTSWTQETITISGLSGPTQGWIAFRYFVPDTQDNGSDIKLDTVSFAPPATPPTSFTRSASGNWSDTTGWTPTGFFPNGIDNIANLVLPASGTQTVNLQGATFTVNQLNVTGTGAGAWTVSNGTLVFDGATPTFTNQSTATGITATLGVNLQLNADTTFNTQNAGAITALSGTISGAGNVIITGPGTFLINTAQNYSTETIINQGTFEAGSANVFSANSAVILSTGGTLNLGNANQTIASLAGTGGQVDLGTSSASPATLTVGGDNTPTIYAGSISGFGGLNKVGTGTLTLTGSTTYTGTTTISAGTVAGGAVNSLSPNSAFSIANGATLDISAASQVIGSLAGVTGSNVNLGAKTLTIGGDNTSTTFSGLISGTGSLIKNGAGTFTILGTDNYSGGTTIGGGTLQLGNGVTNGSISGNVNDNGTLTFDESGPVTFTGVISGAGNLVQEGNGTLTLTRNNIYGGATNVASGTLQAGLSGAFSAASAFTVTSVLDLNGFNNTIGSLSGSGTVTNSSLTTATLTVGNVAATTFSGVINNGNSVLALTKVGAGTLTLNGTTTYSGATNITAGVLAGGALNSLSPSSAFIIASGATLDTSLADQAIGSLAGVVGATVTLGAHTLTTGGDNTSTTYAGLITGSGILTKLGTGTLTLSGTSNYTGATNITAGTLAGGASNSLSPSSAFVITNGATLDISLADQTIGSLAGVAGAPNLVNLGAHTLTIGGDNTSTVFNGIISGTGSLIKNGSGTFTLTQTNNYSGGTTIESGMVIAASNGALGTGPLLVTGASNTLEINAGATLTNLVTLSNGGIFRNSGTLNEGASTLNITNGGTIANTVGGVISASQIQSTLAAATVLNGGTINANITFGNFANTVQLFTGSSIVGNLNLGTNAGTNLILDGSGAALLSQVVTGTLTNGGSLVKQGTGTWTLDRDVSAPVSTNITTGMLVLAGQLTSPQVIVSNGATLQFGNGGTAGSLVGNVVDNGSIFFDRSDSLTFAGVISGAGNVTKNGSGTTVLSAINTYNGGTVVNAGTLLVNSTQALGLGNVVVNGGILGADPQPINVKGNYTQNAGGTLQLQVAGANAGQYDFLSVGGNANLGGTLQLISPVYQPKAGDLLTLVTTGGVVSGQFARFVSPFTAGPGLNTIDLVYGRNSVQLQFLNVTTPISPVIPTVPTTPSSPAAVPPKVVATLNFASFAFTSDQRSAATLLDQVELDPRTANLIGFLFKQPLANLPGDFEQISPAGLTAFYEISFSGTNIQKLNLEGRFDDIRNGSNGFSSNVRVNGAAVSLEDKATVDGKSSKSTVEPILQPGPENRWGVWMTGFGDFVTVDADSNANGYDFTTGGVSLGIDYRILDHLVIGVMGDYAHTWTSLNPSGHIDVDTGRGGVYATWYNHGLYLNGAIYGGHNSYESSRSTLGGLAAGSTEGAEFSTFAGGGYDFNFGHLTVGPIASIQYTYANIDGFSEKSSLAPLEIHSASAESLRTDFGFRASFHWQIGKILVEPAIKAAWEHEYKYSALPITAGFAAIPGPAATFFGPSEGHDSAVVSAGITVQLTPAIATYLNYDGQLGRDRYDSNAVTGGVRITF